MGFRNRITRASQIGAIDEDEKGAPDGVATLSPNVKVEQERGIRGCRLTASVAQLIPTAQFIPLTFDTESFDSGGYADLGVNNTRLTIVEAGFFLVIARTVFSNSIAGTLRIMTLQKNGADYRSISTPPSSPGPRHTIIEFDEFAANDFLNLTAFQDSGADANVGNAAETIRTRLQAFKVGPPSADGL